MLDRAKEIIEDVAKETDSVILLHSMSGKDSIALMDLVYPHFKRVLCVYMYVVPNLSHINRYYAYTKRKYPNVEFVQIPHYGLMQYRKEGFMGTVGDGRQRKYNLSEIIGKVRERFGIEWCVLGFKQSDSLNRRLMLRSYKDGKEAINWKTKMCYPLSTYKNSDVLDYIEKNHLKNPERYSTNGKFQSNGVDITNYSYLKYLQQNFPSDLQKIYNAFPATCVIISQTESKINQEQKQS